VTTDRLPRYRILTGPDDASFCYRVSDGTFTWTTPSGRQYTTGPTEYPI
jgi:hypothetical protein